MNGVLLFANQQGLINLNLSLFDVLTLNVLVVLC